MDNANDTPDSSPAFGAQDDIGVVVKSNVVRRLRRSLLVGAAALVVVLFVAASRYQPLSISPGMAVMGLGSEKTGL